MTGLGLCGKPQGSYLVAQAGSEIAGTGTQTVSGREPAQAAGADGGKPCPARGEIHIHHRIYKLGTSAPSACHTSVPGSPDWRLCRLTLLYATVYPQCLANSRYSINAGIVTASALSLGVLTTYRYLTLTS